MKLLFDQIRKEKNMTQDELSALSGVSKRMIQNYIYGKSDPTLSKLKQIADALDVKVSDLFIE